mmetsp:Transcript_18613/g.43143  ORF Transcript_18613/g.43143 Transcript_18613/m.43143 type:complete len:113 (-) Transcript_18613:374-712(-)
MHARLFTNQSTTKGRSSKSQKKSRQTPHKNKRPGRSIKMSSESALQDLLKDKSRFQVCPNCGHGIEKNGGCDHVTCICKHAFCWICLAPYRGSQGINTLGAKAHQTSCTYYR